MATLREYMGGLDKKGREAFAKRAGTTVGNLVLIRGGFSAPSLEKSIAIERASGGAVRAEALRPDLASSIKYLRKQAA